MKLIKNERGVVFVEAAVVFPIMFLVVFLMIYVGNAYWQKCKVEALVTDYAFRGAAYCADPLLMSVESENIPDLEDHQVYPYRALDPNGAGTIAEDVAGELEGKIEKIGNGLFKGMKPQNVHVTPIYHNSIICATFSLDVDYKIELPIRMIGQKDNYTLKMTTRMDMPVSDTTEMIRTINMVEDYLEQMGVMEKIDEFKAKISETIGKAKEWMGF